MAEQILKLTGVITKGDSPGIYIGYIKELSGIVAQGDSEDEVYEDLIEGTRGMLEYKRKEALALLQQQTHSPTGIHTNASLDFNLTRELVELEHEAC